MIETYTAEEIAERLAKLEAIASRIVVMAQTHYVEDFMIEDLADEAREVLGWSKALEEGK